MTPDEARRDHVMRDETSGSHVTEHVTPDGTTSEDWAVSVGALT
jgi:hypothetical protein